MADEPGPSPAPVEGTAQRHARSRRRPGAWLLGVLFLFSGAALIANITMAVPLPISLTGGVLVAVVILVVSVRSLAPDSRRTVTDRIVAGGVAALPALVLYDVTKQLLAQLDPSPYDPFEAIRRFGELLLGPGADPGAIVVAGYAFHALNGVLFAIAFAVLVLRSRYSGPQALVAGFAWGLFLEAFQLALFPAWLGIRFMAEFATISVVAHLVYGATLGLLARQVLRTREGRRAPWTPGPTPLG